MSRCPEAEMRAAMDDGEFWAHVFGQDGPDYDPDDDAGAPRPEDPTFTLIPCAVCGCRLSACGYDEEGRPMIHATEDDDG